MEAKPSRFALLKIDDDEDAELDGSKQNQQKKGALASKQKKVDRNSKKKMAAALITSLTKGPHDFAALNAESSVFTTTVAAGSGDTQSKTAKKRKTKASLVKDKLRLAINNNNHSDANDPFLSGSFSGGEEQEIQEAIRVSREQFERDEQTRQTLIDQQLNDAVIESMKDDHVTDQLLNAQLDEKNKEIDKLRSDLNKAKSKMKQVLNILQETETREKAELVFELQKVKKLNDELNEQIQSMTNELQTTKSRCFDLEKELKVLKAK